MNYKVYASTGLFKSSIYSDSVEYIAEINIQAESEQDAIQKAKLMPENSKYLKRKHWTVRKV
jgi:hypothetical protein